MAELRPYKVSEFPNVAYLEVIVTSEIIQVRKFERERPWSVSGLREVVDFRDLAHSTL